ncbi:MAG: hypothetical protein IPH33_13425 [Bacteroidetes bacterium]|nr:hypothetical protein [Bacteroidota bacterium]
MYLKFTFVLPAARTITMFVDVFAVTVNGNTSNGSQPVFTRLKPKSCCPLSLVK